MVSSWTHDGTSALPKRVVHHLTPKDAVEHHLQQLVVAAAATVLLARGLHERLLEEQPLRQVASGWTWWPGCASMDDDSLRATLTVVLVVPDADDFTTPLAICKDAFSQHGDVTQGVLELTNCILTGIDALFLFHVHIILDCCLF
ncbi:uncharacterized protein LOC119362728 isoform X2 [Triticum dicoccoides]|uniref:uncharacterized protein LOC119362728 isoform X2 n=1 Tax=Triticum dicoccoides TaxID=85692 RepID=UPI00188E2583|nr:uncharacterized protein LOC119362728 isoform X2 [Triticum dicoccoides]XP_037483892.1 uncharacterized protein LOC119362728 isoform X2 [Triticum dicoccoides]